MDMIIASNAASKAGASNSPEQGLSRLLSLDATTWLTLCKMLDSMDVTAGSLLGIVASLEFFQRPST